MNNTAHQNVITRFAPSPTGFLHVGAARTALFNFLYAKQNKGTMLLRVEDTDTKRSKKEFEDDIVAGLRWLSLSYDGLYRQSERTEIYRKHIRILLEKDAAYTSREERAGETVGVIRFRNPGRDVFFTDTVRGKITFNTKELGDFIIARDENRPLYHLAAVIDDCEMNVTHLIRGEDHISNTPRQILLQEAIGAPRPSYTHLPLVLAPDRSKLSKRAGAASIREYREAGYLPEAIVNFLALLGWSPQVAASGANNMFEESIFNLKELIRVFSLEKIQKGGAVFDNKKLDWINKAHIKKLSRERCVEYIDEFLPAELKRPPLGERAAEKLMPIIIERINAFGDIMSLYEEGEFDYLLEHPIVKAEDLRWKGTAPKTTMRHLDAIINMLENLTSESFDAEDIKAALWDYATDAGRGEVLWPMRYALTGREKSPDPFTVAGVLGKEETRARLQSAAATLKKSIQ